ncbi:GATA transcription factor 12-like [Tripterygium wilfordii]|uniref:GATA transcription factor n=1 Tax=Tripterygium wilfordii TaxID=458696 RepID=A0A7J7D5N6_TRIWF|nr:GATA transcription factor 9-like [Tripterygium wilfordii]KAF5741660.1 GATA transcription factor 12-like [Tripterygium wilfordii]
MEASDFFYGGYYGAGSGDHFSQDKRISEQKPGDHFAIDDLLDFSNDDAIMTDGFFHHSSDNVIRNNSSDSFLLASIDSCNSSVSGVENNFIGVGSQFSGELCVPYDDVAELEWLSNFVEDSFSAEHDVDAKYHYLPGPKAPTPESSSSDSHSEQTRSQANAIFQTDAPLPGKARSRRSRAAPCDWTTRLLRVSPTTKPVPAKKRENPNSNSESDTGPVRKCLHCASEKTPQWRTGPMGPKTLCNACGVRYKSGRLVPEYRPASSPTFLSAKHSNSHRKVLELRRQKDLQRSQHQQFLGQSSMFGISNGADDFSIHHHSGPDFRHMI